MAKALVYTLAGIGIIVLLLPVPGRTADPVPTPKTSTAPSQSIAHGLWSVYELSLEHARYIDLTHTLSPSIPVWEGFGRSRFKPGLKPGTGESRFPPGRS